MICYRATGELAEYLRQKLPKLTDALWRFIYGYLTIQDDKFERQQQ